MLRHSERFARSEWRSVYTGEELRTPQGPIFTALYHILSLARAETGERQVCPLSHALRESTPAHLALEAGVAHIGERLAVQIEGRQAASREHATLTRWRGQPIMKPAALLPSVLSSMGMAGCIMAVYHSARRNSR
jgi:hypothetical protein